jgi:hypothetical protein
MSSKKTKPKLCTKENLYILIIVVFALGIRALSCLNDLWIDEIWSIQNLSGISSWTEIITTLRTDNNHPLTSIYLYLIGETKRLWIYRLFSLFFGLCTLTFIAISTKDNVRNFRLALIGFSFFFVLYDSEARGYGAIVFFTLVSLSCINLKIGTTRNFPQLIIFWISNCLGFLSHILFLQGYMAIFAYSLTLACRREIKWRRFFELNSVPPIFLLFLFQNFIKYLPEGSGPLARRVIVIFNTVSVALGGPEFSPFGVHYYPIVLLTFFVIFYLLVTELLFLLIMRDSRVILYLFGILISPATFILITDPKVLFPRYFILPILFLYLLLSEFLARLWSKGHFNRLLSVSITICFVVINFYSIAKLISVGRGEYRQALEYITKNSAEQTIYYSSNPPLARTLDLIKFYQPFLEKKFSFVAPSAENNQYPNWILIHDQDLYSIPSSTIEESGITYELREDFSYAGLSGWRWFIFEMKRD